MKTVLTIFLYLLTVFCTFGQSREDLLKASFVGKISQYTEWAVNNNDTLFWIQSLGSNDFTTVLKRMYHKKLIKNKMVLIEEIDSLSEIKNPNILYIAPQYEEKLKQVKQIADKRNILTISDHTQFANKGSQINFYISKMQTLHFEVNIKHIESAQIHLDYLLIDIAKIINE